MISFSAPGKLNLCLDVIGKRPDGYHDIRSVMQTISLADEITVELDCGQWVLECTDQRLPTDGSNLAMAAAKVFHRRTGLLTGGARISIEKKIPVFAGLGGGSADAGAVLRELNSAFDHPLDDPQLLELALELGSDVPYCVHGSTRLVEGRGEHISALPSMPHCWLVLCKPGIDLGAGQMYGLLDKQKHLIHPDIDGFINSLGTSSLDVVAKKCSNVFYPLVLDLFPELAGINDLLLKHGALSASMTGKGPTMFGIFSERSTAENAMLHLKKEYSHKVFIAEIE